MVERINFYGRTMPYFEFSNFYRATIFVDGSTWKTSEHYYQAMKFYGHSKYVEEVRQTNTPMMAARIGRDPEMPRRKDWDEVKDDVMYKALYAKFTQHYNLRKLLLETGDAYIAEHTAFCEKYQPEHCELAAKIIRKVTERNRK